MEDRQTTKTKTKRRFLWVFGLLVLLCVIMRLTILDPRDPGIVFGPDTTYVDAPKNPDGTPNYIAWLNQKHSKGMTAENNAAVLIAKVFDCRHSGSDDVPGLTHEDLERLELDQKPEPDKMFVWFEVVEAELKESGCLGDSTKLLEYPGPRGLVGKVWSDQDYPQVSRWIDKNRDAIDTIVAASKRTHYFIPIYSISENSNLEDALCGWKPPSLGNMGSALAVRATMSVNQGDIEGAWNDIIALHRLGRLLAQSPFFYMDHLFGYAFDENGHKLIAMMAGSGMLDSSRSHEFLSDLKTMGTFQMPDDWLILNRLGFLDMIMLYRRKGGFATEYLPEPMVMDYNLILMHCNAYWCEIDKAMKLPRADRQKTIDRINSPFTKKGLEECKKQRSIFRIGGRLFEYRYTDLIAKEFIRLFAQSSHCNELDYQVVAAVRLDLSKVVLALAAYKADRGAYPKTLDALMPAYLDTIPQDRFAEAPLIYKPGDDGYVLYSVGRNCEDDGGDAAISNDIVVRIPVEDK